MKNTTEVLKKAFRNRYSFLDVCFGIGVPVGNRPTPTKLEDVRSEPEWREILLAAIDAWSGPPDVRAQTYSWLTPAALKTYDDASKRGDVMGSAATEAESRTSQGQPGKAHAFVPHQVEERNVVERTAEHVESFVKQHLINFFVDREYAKKAGIGEGPEAAEEMVERWRGWHENEILIFFDATILEVLAERRLLGRSGVDAYNRTVGFVRNRRAQGLHDSGAGEAVKAEAHDTYFVPARSRLENMMLAASEREWPAILWSFIHNGKAITDTIDKLIVDTIDKLEVHIVDVARWILQLRAHCAGVGYVDYLAKKPTGEDSWFFDPDRLKGVVTAAKSVYALAVRKAKATKPYVYVEGDADLKTADCILDAHRVFIAACQLGSDPDYKNWTGASKILTADSPIEARTAVLDGIWWSSFDAMVLKEKPNVVSGEAPKEELKMSEAVARFCCGPRFDMNKVVRDPSGADRPRVVTVEIPLKTTHDGRKLVTVLGAGIAGLTAAHELAERGFKVTVLEAVRGTRKEDGAAQVGGVARTQWFDATNPESKKKIPNVPGEHGYRLFPSFYRHVFDTMKRTPLESETPGVYPTAFDQLVPTYQQVFARRRHYVPMNRTRPRSLEAFRSEYMRLTEGLEFEKRDLSRFFFKLLRYLMSCSERRAAEYEKMNFLEFIGGPERYSATFLDAVRAAPQALVAMDAEHCDARTQCNVYLQLLMDQVLGGQYTDSTLRGPTSTAWLNLWRDHLARLKVEFVNAEVLSLRHRKVDSKHKEECFELVLDADDLDKIGEAKPDTDGRVRLSPVDYIVVALDPRGAERVTRGWDSKGVPAELQGFGSDVDVRLPAKLERCDVVCVFMQPTSRDEADKKLREMLTLIRGAKERTETPATLRSVFRSLSEVTGALSTHEVHGKVSEYRVTLWFQHKVGPEELRRFERAIQRWVDGTQEVRLTSVEPEVSEAPSTVRSPRLPDDTYGATSADRFQTFTGVQYYFEQDFKLVRGHVYFPDTDWGLSAVSQSQFWWSSKNGLPPNIRGVLSVDIGDCRKKSSYTGKSLVQSSAEEIVDEVWRQVKDALSTTRGGSSIVTNLPLPNWDHSHIDGNLEFSGPDLRANRTPFLINNVGDWDKRPRCMPWLPGENKFTEAPRTAACDVWQAPHGGYRIHDNKVVFCGHYMRTFTRMTTMEAANESARHAVNAILSHMAWSRGGDTADKTPVSGDYCEIWDIEQNELEEMAFFKRVDEMLFKAGKPHMADILQFDKLADTMHPTLSDGQALANALGVTTGKDWGVQPGEIVAALNGLVEVAKKMSGELYGSGSSSPVQTLLAMLGIDKSASPPKR